MDNNFVGLMMRAIENNPGMLDTPMKQEMYKALKSGDSKRGEELANNYCQTMNISDRNQAVNSASNFIMQRFQQRR